MDGDRTLIVLRDPDQWARCRHESTALAAGGGIELDWRVDPVSPDRHLPTDATAATEPIEPAGLAFDRWCRAYRSAPRRGVVDVSQRSGVAERPAAPGLLRSPRGLAVDRAQRLYVVERGAAAVHVVDLWGQRLLRRVPIRTPLYPDRRPVDVVARGCEALVLTARPSGLVRLSGRRGPLPGPVLRRPACRGVVAATRVTAAAEDVLVLWTSSTERPDVVATPRGRVVVRVAHATDVELTGDGLLVVARRPGEPFATFRRTAGRWIEQEPLRAPGYDGGAVATAPDGRLAYTTAAGWAWGSGSAARFASSGRLVSYRLDSGTYRTRWGRLFLAACVPPGTSVRAGFLSTDDDEVDDPVDARPPAHGAPRLPFPDLTPPLPSGLALQALPPTAPLFRGAAVNGEARYDAPVTAGPGRYLWVVLELTGTARATPRVRALEVEAPGHRLAAQLPAVWTRNEPDAAFLQRLLAPGEGVLHDLDERAGTRAELMDPTATPAEGLTWLAGLVGIVLDGRWPLVARRALVAEAFTLFRTRGTQACLERMLEICFGRRVPVVENWRVRGLGGAVLGPESAGPAPPAVAQGTGDTSLLGRFTVGGLTADQDGYTATAHRFTVLVPRDLTEDERQALASLIELNKPAHTMAEVCEMGGGMRLGRTSRVDLTTVVAPDPGWGTAVVGQVLVGGDGVVGLPAVGSRVEQDTREGLVRVG